MKNHSHITKLDRPSDGFVAKPITLDAEGDGILLIRSATGNAEQLDRQLEALKHHCHETKRRPRLLIASGEESVDDGPGLYLQQIEEAMGEGWCRWVMADSLDRYSRRTPQLDRLLRLSLHHDVEVWTLTPKPHKIELENRAEVVARIARVIEEEQRRYQRDRTTRRRHP
jgi:hypothetical protein